MTSFAKMEGLGNDFILVEGPAELDPAEVVRWTDRRWGIGADGVLIVSAGDSTRVRLDIYNADGSRAELSGNGLRCAARYAVDRGWVNGEEFAVETMAGLHRVTPVETGELRVELGRVAIGDDREVGGWVLHTASIGNPHAVIIVSDPELEEVTVVGPRIEAEFPAGANVGFVSVENPDRLRLRVWERGVGETLACGTGAAAAHAVLHARGLSGPEVMVMLRGGPLGVELVDGVSWISGPARYVFEGRWEDR